MVIASDLVQRFPRVKLFFVAPDEDAAYVLRCIKSNGINMLCCDEAGALKLISLTTVAKVQPISDDDFMSYLDSQSGSIIARSTTGEQYRTGPVRPGRVDASINLTEVARGFGVDITCLVDEPKACAGAPVPGLRVVDDNEMAEAPAAETAEPAPVIFDESILEEIERLSVCDLSDLYAFELEPETEPEKDDTESE